MKRLVVFPLVLLCLFSLAACGQALQDSLPGTYLYEKEGFGGGLGDFSIQLYDNGTFQYYEGPLSSYIGTGDWTLEGDVLVLTDTTGYSLVNRFQVDGTDLIYRTEGSSGFVYVDVADGDLFHGCTQ